MPVNLEGVKDTVKALRKYDPELLKEMNKEIRGVMVPIRNLFTGVRSCHYLNTNPEIIALDN